MSEFAVEDRGERGTEAGRWQVRHLASRRLVIAPDTSHPSGRAVAFPTRARADEVVAWAVATGYAEGLTT